MAQKQVLGLFDSDQKAAQATDALIGLGLTPGDFDILSGVPYPEGAFGEHSKPHHLYVFPFAGAVCGLAVALFFTAGSQVSFPVVTGGKPILAIPPMAIISYEGTLLGAIIFTVFGVFFESRLGRGIRGPYDPRITEGLIGVVVTCRDDLVNRVRTTLNENAAVDVKVEGEGQAPE